MKLNKTSAFLNILTFAALTLAKVNVMAQTGSGTAVLLPNEILQLSDDPAIKSSIMIADKTERKLYFFESEESLTAPLAFEIDIGKKDGNKTKRNDRKPGRYLPSAEKLTQPEIPFDQYGSLAFTTDYPNVFDKFENKTGDGIWLHSVPDTVPLNRGSKGCVVLRNENIQKLSDLIALNRSHIIINAKTNWVDGSTHEAKRNKVKAWLATWKDYWQQQDLDNYIKLYSDDFSAPSFNKKSWLKHKEKLKGVYKTITIDFSKPSILHTQNQYIIKFVQNYSSDMHQDTGIKTLYLIEKGDELQILREEWSKL